MIDFAVLASGVTVLAILIFVVVVAWAVHPRQKQRFDAAAKLPFALPDDAGIDHRRSNNSKRPAHE